MISLGIESTAHTFAASVVDKDWKVMSNVIDSFTTESGGMIPGKVADHHVEVCGRVVQKALDDAGKSIKDMDLISFSQGPGLGHCLRIGAMAARSLAILHNKPLVGVNHCIAHLEIGRALTRAKDPVLLYVSGANTQVIAYEGRRYRIFGETLDNGIGNFLDSFAREMGLGFPGGPKVQKLAEKGREFVELPYNVKGMDVSFGGLLTNLKQKIGKGYRKEDLCFSVQETVFAMMTEVAERALAHTMKTELVLGGGVACNSRLQEMCRIMCKERGAKSYVLENQFNIDNAAMIAIAGIMMHSAGIELDPKEADIKPYERTDDIEVRWRK